MGVGTFPSASGGGIKTVQRGVFTVDVNGSNAPWDVTITSVTMSKSFVTISSRVSETISTTQDTQKLTVAGHLEAATTLRLRWGPGNTKPAGLTSGGVAPLEVRWEVVEFN